MNMDELFITLLMAIVVAVFALSIFICFIMKASGCITYEDKQEQKALEEWIKKKGEPRLIPAVMMSFLLFSSIIFLIFFLFTY